MNLLIVTPQDFISADTVKLCGRRLEHLHQVLKAKPGDSLRIGQLNGQIGSGQIQQLDEQQAVVSVTLDQPAPEALPLTLILALPRPKMLKRILQTASTMGVKELYLINAYKVDKSYWSTPILQPEKLREQLLLGLEQAGDTRLMQVHQRKRFKPFVEDELPGICLDSRAIVAHPYQAKPCPEASWEQTTLAVGPEGGFIPYEVEKLNQAGMQSVHLGQRILRVETAVPALLSRLFPLP